MRRLVALGFFAVTTVTASMMPVWLFFPLPFLALFLLLPLWMSQSVADVSTSCDILTESINERRVEDLDRSPRLLALELALKNLNSCQGLGFVIGGTVLD